MEKIWFRKTDNGLFWKPITWHGQAIIALWVLLNIWYLFRVDKVSYTIGETFLNWGIFFIGSTIVLLFIIKKRSDRNWM